MKILQFQDVYYKSEGNDILNGISLSVDEGEFLTITGPSGSGKSTILKLINDLISPTSGYIFYRGKSLCSYDPVALRKDVCLCFQMPYLFNSTVYDNLTFPFSIRKADVDIDIIKDKIKMFNLEEDFLYKDIRNLSGGEKQRIALARALIFKPDILLLDEITSALDEKNVHTVETNITQLNSQGVTVLWVTHDPSQARRIGTKNIQINKGRVSEVRI